MGITEDAAKLGTAAVGAMQSQPLAIALLFVNLVFVGFSGYVLSIIGGNAATRDKINNEMIGGLIKQIGDCRQGRPGASILRLPPVSPATTWINDVTP